MRPRLLGTRMAALPVSSKDRPLPQPEAPLARRTAIVAFLFFTAASAMLAVVGVDLATLSRAFPLYALGGFSILIFGTSRLLISGMAGRDIVGGAATSLAMVATGAVGAAGLFFTQDGPRPAAVLFAALWSVGALLHAIVTLATVRRPATRSPIVDPTATRASRLPVRLLEAGALVYAVAAAIMVPLAYAGAVARAGAFHVVLVGFVIVTMMGVAAHILPRFTRARIPAGALALLVPLAMAGPAFMALGLEGRASLLRVGAVVEGLAFALFGGIVVTTLLRAHRSRLPHVGYAAAPLAVGVGGVLALVFAWRGALADQLATHGLLNVFGFVGLFVMAASTDLYGPALAAGASSARRHAAIGLGATMVALAVAAVGTGMAFPLVARAGMALYAAALVWQTAGLMASHRRADRVISRLR